MKIQKEDQDLVIFESALYRTTTSLIIGENYLLLVDPNWLPNEIAFIHHYISGIDSGQEKYLVFTHSDYDHIIGYGKFKEYQTIASKNFVENANKESILEQIQAFDDEYYIARSYVIEYPPINKVIEQDSEIWQLHGDEYLFFQASGHNPDGIIFWNKTKGILVLGDYLSNIEFPFVDHSFEEYHKTLDTIEEILQTKEVQILITGHGDFTTSPNEMNQRLEDSRSYLNELAASITENKTFDTEKIALKYQFYKPMMKCHIGNIANFKKENPS